MPETYLEGDIEFTFFRYPECGEVYPVCATDSALRADIAEYTRMRNLIRVKTGEGRLHPQGGSLETEESETITGADGNSATGSFFDGINACDGGKEG